MAKVVVTDSEYRKNLAINLVSTLESQRDLMVAVSTGGPRIDDVNTQYKKRRKEIKRVLGQLDIEDPIPYDDLWDWYGRWSNGDLSTYRSRRIFLREMFSPLVSHLEKISRGLEVTSEFKMTGWQNVDRVIEKMRVQLGKAKHEEDFQQIGLLAREALISLGKTVYDEEKHKTADGIKPSDTDAARMLAAYFSTELGGQSNQELRAHAKASLKLAVSLQHMRRADFRRAAMCAEATTSVVNIVAISTGQRDRL